MSKEEKQAFFSTVCCLIFLISGKTIELMDVSFYPLLFVIAIVSGGWKQTFEGVSELIHEKTLNVDLLMALAAIGACLIGNWFEGAMLTFIFCLSGALEEYATNKSTKEITALMNLSPSTALKLTPDNKTIETDVNDLIISDLVFVPKGSAVPIDGILLDDHSSIDESAISGESIPVEKRKGEEVFGGTINTGQAFTMKVTKTSKNTLFAQIIKLVENAQSETSATASFIEKIENSYVKIVLLAVPLVILITHFIVGWSFQESFYRGMVLLVVASPCALVASATPATLSAISNGAKKGVLFKSGKNLEQLADLKAVSFDKTGTLTQGKPRVTDFHALDPDPLIPRLFASMEAQSTHPLALATVRFFENETRISNLKVEEKAGYGLEADYAGYTWSLGKTAQYTEDSEIGDMIRAWRNDGKTLIFLSKNQRLMAMLALIDLPKKDTASMISYFKNENIHTTMLTGDHEGSAAFVAKAVGIDDYYANCLPQEKTVLVQELKEKYTVNAMVGDGINDAPALATATIGVAMGEGTDVAMDVSDIVLMKNDLNKLVYSHRLAKKLKRIVKQNIIFSLTVIALLIISNFAQFLNLPLGVIGHEGSTILVIFNGLRMLLPLKDLSSDQNDTKCLECPLYQVSH
ncbi:ATPase [Enterococcus florum]|uniref:ATPase n=1 Tax=Enterococcus florum TaxID=2480627 RepID=A0A4P5P933_9ENTE|nr:heavy metal translocating P-type ATPase [Enterococcus florum]GCF94575.1 ATPase [Enterococcus florum]